MSFSLDKFPLGGDIADVGSNLDVELGVGFFEGDSLGG